MTLSSGPDDNVTFVGALNREPLFPELKARQACHILLDYNLQSVIKPPTMALFVSFYRLFEEKEWGKKCSHKTVANNVSLQFYDHILLFYSL